MNCIESFVKFAGISGNDQYRRHCLGRYCPAAILEITGVGSSIPSLAISLIFNVYRGSATSRNKLQEKSEASGPKWASPGDRLPSCFPPVNTFALSSPTLRHAARTPHGSAPPKALPDRGPAAASPPPGEKDRGLATGQARRESVVISELEVEMDYLRRAIRYLEG